MELNIEEISNKNYSFQWNHLMKPIKVDITIPNLSGLKHSVWGDWGAMYSFELDNNQSIALSYDETPANITQKKLQINSPMLASVRDNYPYYLVVEDEAKNIKMNLFIDQNYDLGRVEVTNPDNQMVFVESMRETYTGGSGAFI